MFEEKNIHTEDGIKYIRIRVSKTGGTGTCEKSLSSKHNKKTGQNCQNQVFRTLKINHRLKAMKEIFIQEKMPNLSKNSNIVMSRVFVKF